jgi:hypothetical protein
LRSFRKACPNSTGSLTETFGDGGASERAGVEAGAAIGWRAGGGGTGGGTGDTGGEYAQGGIAGAGAPRRLELGGTAVEDGAGSAR